MAAYWQPTVTGYLGPIAKPAILQAVSSTTMMIMPMMMTHDPAGPRTSR
jgi:hypothetical protein